MFYEPTSASQRGTLFHIRNKFGHHNVKPKVADCVNKVMDLLRVTTEGFINLAAMNVMDMSTRHNVPPGCPDITSSEEDRKVYLACVARKVVDHIWPNLDMESSSSSSFSNLSPDDDDGETSSEDVENTDGENGAGTFCICGQDNGKSIHWRIWAKDAHLND